MPRQSLRVLCGQKSFNTTRQSRNQKQILRYAALRSE
jgi:hypothetical protein